MGWTDIWSGGVPDAPDWDFAGGGSAGKKSGPSCPQPLAAPRKTKVARMTLVRCRLNISFSIKAAGCPQKNPLECSMSESEFLKLAEGALDHIEAALERAGEAADVDLEASRSGNVLQIEFVDNGSKIIVNTQAAMQEIWVAGRAGGFHYRFNGEHWLNTRDGSELFAALSVLASEQAGAPLVL